MSLPAGVVTRQIQHGDPFAMIGGAELRQRVTLTPSRSLVWAATHQPAVRAPFVSIAEAGEIAVLENVPTTDQSGVWTDEHGNPIEPDTDNRTHVYVVKVEYLRGNKIVSTEPMFRIDLPAGEDPVLLTEIVPVDGEGGRTIFVPDTYGPMLAAAQAAAEAAQAASAIATPDGVIASRILDPASLTAAALESTHGTGAIADRLADPGDPLAAELDAIYGSGADTGWVACTAVDANWSVGSAYDYRGLAVRRVGKKVRLEGALTRGSGQILAGYSGARVPVGYRPPTSPPRVPLSYNLYLAGGGDWRSGNNDQIYLDTSNGEVTFDFTIPGTDTTAFFSTEWFVD